LLPVLFFKYDSTVSVLPRMQVFLLVAGRVEITCRKQENQQDLQGPGRNHFAKRYEFAGNRIDLRAYNSCYHRKDRDQQYTFPGQGILVCPEKQHCPTQHQGCTHVYSESIGRIWYGFETQEKLG